jgi:hypothetical protein
VPNALRSAVSAAHLLELSRALHPLPRRPTLRQRQSAASGALRGTLRPHLRAAHPGASAGAPAAAARPAVPSAALQGGGRRPATASIYGCSGVLNTSAGNTTILQARRVSASCPVALTDNGVARQTATEVGRQQGQACRSSRTCRGGGVAKDTRMLPAASAASRDRSSPPWAPSAAELSTAAGAPRSSPLSDVPA